MQASPERRAEADALLAAFAACTDHTTYWHSWRAVHHRMNVEDANCRFDEAERIRVEMNRINRAVKPRIEAMYAAIRTYTTAELIERAASASAATDAAIAQIKHLHADTASHWDDGVGATLIAAE